jgi:hypothetical protein
VAIPSGYWSATLPVTASDLASLKISKLMPFYSPPQLWDLALQMCGDQVRKQSAANLKGPSISSPNSYHYLFFFQLGRNNRRSYRKIRTLHGPPRDIRQLAITASFSPHGTYPCLVYHRIPQFVIAISSRGLFASGSYRAQHAVCNETALFIGFSFAPSCGVDDAWW